jgi:hypothetical protein
MKKMASALTFGILAGCAVASMTFLPILLFPVPNMDPAAGGFATILVAAAFWGGVAVGYAREQL